MGEEPAKAEPERYRAFISYSHGDAKFAHWLHRKLESWRLPDKSRLTPVFIDRAELAAGSDLSAQVREALDQSAALIVVCSPNARASRWVGQEIALFRALHPDRPVLAALIDGEPDAAFPAPLLGTGDSPLEPLAADFRKGHDGQRLGLIKLVAGLTALPLDRLVQRDAQARQRRVMAITAAALALVLILSAALVIALRARAEAERQRAEAEGLVEFMLTDLRDKLEGVGRLEIMGAVNARAMAHYSDAQSLGNLEDPELRQRAKLMQTMAEDELATTGGEKRALAAAIAAYNLTGRLTSRNPSDYENIFAHAQSAFWLGYAHNLQKDKARAAPYWAEYHTLALRLLALRPADPRSRQELAFAQGNLCTLDLMPPADTASAIKHCRESLESTVLLAQTKPGQLQSGLDVLNRQGWLADAFAAAGQLQKATELRFQQQATAEELVRSNPKDARAHEALLRANLGLVMALNKAGDYRKALEVGAKASVEARRLMSLDPQNKDWQSWHRDLQNEITSR